MDLDHLRDLLPFVGAAAGALVFMAHTAFKVSALLIESREASSIHRARVDAFMQRADARLASVDVSVANFSAFRSEAQAYMESFGGRMDRLERAVDAHRS